MTRRDAALLITLGAVWGSVFPLASLVLQDLPALVVALARTGLSAAVLVPVAWSGGVLLAALRRRPLALLTASVVQMSIPVVLLTTGQTYVSAGLAGILLGTQPAWAAVITAVLDRRLPVWTAAGMLLGLGGTVLLFWSDLHGPTAPLGGAMLVAAAAGYAAGAVYIQRRLPGTPPSAVAASALATTCLLLTPPVLAAAPFPLPGPATTAWLLVLGTAATGGALLLFYLLIERVGAVKANLAAYLAPGFALVYDLPLGHRPSPSALSGLALILLGSAIAARPGEPRSPVAGNPAQTAG